MSPVCSAKSGPGSGISKSGHVVEDGAPAELIAGKGHYAELDAAWRDGLA